MRQGRGTPSRAQAQARWWPSSRMERYSKAEEGRGEGTPFPKLPPVFLHPAGIVFFAGLGGVEETGGDGEGGVGTGVVDLGGGGGGGEAVGNIPEEVPVAIGGEAVGQGQDIVPRREKPHHRLQPLQGFLQPGKGGGDGVRRPAQFRGVLRQAVPRRQHRLAGGAAAGLDKSQGPAVQGEGQVGVQQGVPLFPVPAQLHHQLFGAVFYLEQQVLSGKIGERGGVPGQHPYLRLFLPQGHLRVPPFWH